jgi:hypothetical protein
MKKNSYIAFVDLLGTSDLSRSNPTKFYNSLITFQETISNSSSLLGSDGSVFVFSDCAYLESKSLDTLVRYIRDVRRTLMEEGYYLKGSIGQGSLEARELHNTGKIRDQKILSQRRKVVKGSSFGQDVVGIYGLQDGLRGIGIRIHEDLKDEIEKRGFAVSSCHLPQINNRHAECFKDLKFEKRELQDGVLLKFLKNFFMTNTKSKRFGRYYLSFIISWIKSSDFTDVNPQEETDSKDTTPLIYQLLINGALEKYLVDLVGIEYIYFTFLDRIYEQCESQKVIMKIQNQVASRKKLVACLENLPDCLFGQKSRSKFLEYLSGRIGPSSL